MPLKGRQGSRTARPASGSASHDQTLSGRLWGGLELLGPILSAWSNSAHVKSKLKAHPDYYLAKAGDAVAALRLVRDLVPKQMILDARERWPGATFLFGTALGAEGINQIPAALAWHLSQYSGGDVAFLTQQNLALRTGATASERLLFRPEFKGKVCPGTQYVLTDDVIVLGGTIAEMADFVFKHGGMAVGAAAVVNASRVEQLVPDQGVVKLLQLKYGNELEAILSLAPEALTGPEAAYLARFTDAVALRDRVARARNERGTRINARTRSKKSPPTSRLERDVITRLIDAVDAADGDPDFEAETLEDNADAEPDMSTFYKPIYLYATF